MQQEDPQVTLQKFSKMGVLLLLDSPEHLQFGIDNISWKVGSKFKGIKLIPLGTHIITYSLKSENYMFPIKKFIYFGPTSNETKDDERIRVFKWSSKVQRFVALKAEEAEGYREGVKKYHFDCYLGPYPQQNVQFWNSNTNHISKRVLEKLDPIEYYEDYGEQYNTNTEKLQDNLDANIDSASDEQELADVVKEVEDLQMQESELQEQKIKQSKSKEQNIQEVKKNKDFGGNIYYSDIPRRLTDSKGHTTQINMDRSAVLQAVIKSNWINNQFGILGELQYSFISFLIGQCLDSYDQWKKLTIMISNSQKAFDTHKQLMLEFIAVLYEQLRQFPQDFFIDELAKDNFLGTCLAKLKIYSIEKAINKKSIGRIEKLLSLVSDKFGYQSVEEEDQSPLVVDQHESYF